MATTPDPQAIARSWLDGADASSEALASPQRIAIAWALKHVGYEALQRDPKIVERAAQCLDHLATAGDAEVCALAHWMRGALRIVQGQMAEALVQLEGAAAGFQALGRVQDAAEVQVPKLIALSMLGRHEEAVACAEQTLAQFVAVGDDRSAGKVELNLGSMLLRLDRYEEAARFYRQSASRFARLRDAQHSVMADIGLATVLTWQFEFDEALRIYERSAMRVRVHGLPMLQGQIDLNRGRLELHRGRFPAALLWLEAGLRAIEDSGSPQGLAEARRHLADAYLALNLLPEAVALYERAIHASIDLGGPVEQAWATVQLAVARARLGHTALAAQGFDAARSLFEAQGNEVGGAWVDLHAAALQLTDGDAPSAVVRSGNALTVFEKARVATWRHEAAVLRAAAWAAAGADSDACAQYEQVLQASGELPEIEAACRTGLGALLRRRGDVAAAYAQYEWAAQAIEAQRATLPGDEFRTAYGADKQAPFSALVELALDDGDAASGAHLLRCMERARAQALRLSLQGGSRSDDPADSPRETLRWLDGQWQQAIAAGRHSQAAQFLERARTVEADWLEQQRRAHARVAEAPTLVPTVAFDVEALQEALPTDSAFVEYVLVGQRLVACVVTRAALHWLHWSTPMLGQATEQLRFQIDSLRHGAALHHHLPQLTERARRHLRVLHGMLWEPLANLVEGKERVIVAPHGSLHYVPFCALHDGTSWLIERHDVELTPSAALWLGDAINPRPPRASARRRVLALGVGGASLPHVDAEVRAVAAAFAGDSTILLEAAATQPRLREALQNGAELLHLACHARFRADSPYFSSLQLSDGALTLRDATALPLGDTHLVTLSACETGLSRVAPGDDLLGLVRGFLLAGASQVMATLWTVDDASTASLMGEFYHRLRVGEAPARALRAAQCRLLATHPHPYHWAPFALHGRARDEAPAPSQG